jgi:hypothetical protein
MRRRIGRMNSPLQEWGGAVKSRLMKKSIPLMLMLTLALFCGTAFAEWIEIQRFDDGMRVFADPASARRTGQTAQLTHLVRWGEPQLEPGSPPYRSTVVQTSYDCVAKRERYLASTSYAGAMGDGAKVSEDDDEADAWYSISEASMEDKLWKLACAAR